MVSAQTILELLLNKEERKNNKSDNFATTYFALSGFLQGYWETLVSLADHKNTQRGRLSA